MVDTGALKAPALKACGFESRPRHRQAFALAFFYAYRRRSFLTGFELADSLARSWIAATISIERKQRAPALF